MGARAVVLFVSVATMWPPLAQGRTFWSRGGDVPHVDFAERRPSALGTWKIWLKTGPGKAAALRGTTDVVPARDTSPTRFVRYDQDIHDEEVVYGIPSAFMHAVIQTESDFDPAVVSSVGARGLMQLMPDTARLMGVNDPFNPRQSIMGGARYLQVLARRFCKPSMSGGVTCSSNDNVKVVAAYHAGPGAVEKYGGMPPYETTHAYVQTVLRRYEEWTRRDLGANR